ncbi:hypothetical protein ABID39_001107 [Bartonella japonica]|uniref:Lipoprotein n=1 Tax=Bartonella japonica TaxID=357761 RepID=A0ABV2FPA9_9HYPH
MKKREVKILLISILGLCVVLTGCNLSAPTYGTGKVVSLQFFEDIANIGSLKTKNNNSQLVMKPRPELVEVKPSSHLVLPIPQQEMIQDNSFGKKTTRKQYPSNVHTDISSSPRNKSVLQLNEKQRQEYLRRQRAQVGSAKYR